MTTPEQVTTVEELEALPKGTVGRDSRRGGGVLVEILGRSANGHVMVSYGGELGAGSIVWPVIVFYRPDRPDRPVGPDVEALRGKLANVLSNAMNYPEKVVPHILGQDMGPLIDKVAAVVLAAHPSVVTREQVEGAVNAAWRFVDTLATPDLDEWETIDGAVRAALAALGLPVEEEK